MRQTRAIEFSTGLFALLGFAALFFLTTQITNREIRFGDAGYRLVAKFENDASVPSSASVTNIRGVEVVVGAVGRWRPRRRPSATRSSRPASSA